MTKKDKVIILGTTGNMAFAVANVLMGIKKHSPSLITDIIIYEQNLSENDKMLLNSILSCKFIEYIFPIKMEKFDKTRLNRFTELTFARYECYNLLNEYKKVMWLDIDILIQGDITPMFDFTDKTGISHVFEPYPIWSLFTEKPWGNYDFEKVFFNAGIFVISDNLPSYEKLKDWCYEKSIEYSPILHLPDQAILNLMVQEFNLKLNPMERKYNQYPIGKEIQKAIILHSYSSEKFWNFWDSREWNQNYKKWLKMGGSAYVGKKACFLSREVKKILPHAPDIVRKPKAFVLYLIEEYKRIKNSKKLIKS
ncbi:MAG: hypothetical protein A2X64_07570 [Ignavibacteria bacterium GWF2_33_9]|nr:MAG: hypothetical protein A2X64_07570 [Ignavibacteria bacterium GWF2_33_9]